MDINQLPAMNMDRSETGCCPRFDPAGWDGQALVFDRKLFATTSNACLLHIPLGIGTALGRLWKKILAAGADPKDHYLILTSDPSPWRSVHCIEVTRDVPGAETTVLSGTYLTKAFQGPYRDAPKWCAELARHVAAQGHTPRASYFFYTTCPKCARHFGKNYVVGIAQV